MNYCCIGAFVRDQLQMDATLYFGLDLTQTCGRIYYHEVRGVKF
jgi:hypothetical protein